MRAFDKLTVKTEARRFWFSVNAIPILCLLTAQGITAHLVRLDELLVC